MSTARPKHSTTKPKHQTSSNTTFDVTKFGAIGDGRADDTHVIIIHSICKNRDWYSLFYLLMNNLHSRFHLECIMLHCSIDYTHIYIEKTIYMKIDFNL